VSDVLTAIRSVNKTDATTLLSSFGVRAACGASAVAV
jgi:hypothetical protein